MSDTRTLDEVISYNARRLRENRRWTQAELAERLGVSRHDVMAYEGSRSNRPQRPFRWTELVELCYVFGVTLFELVLPADSQVGVDVRDTALMGMPAARISLSSRPRRDDLGYGLFGVPGDELLKEGVLSTMARRAVGEAQRRRAVLQEAFDSLSERVGEIMAELAQKYPEATFDDLDDSPIKAEDS